MQKEAIMRIHVQVQRDKISELTGPAGTVRMLPFTGTVDGPLFQGTVAPGAVDTQVTNPCEVRHMSARYLLDGTDHTGKHCRIYIENNGWFTNGERPRPFYTIPTFLTDSPALADYLHCSKFRGEGCMQNGQLVISFYEINSQ